MEAKALFQNKAFADAARLFMEAFATVKRATLVYNAARARQEQGAFKRAESLFLMYLTLPDAPEQGKTDARSHLKVVRERLAAGAAPPKPAASSTGLVGTSKTHPPSTAPPGTAPPPAVSRSPAPSARWPAVAAGALGLVALGTYGWAWAIASDLDVKTVHSTKSASDYRANRDSANTLRAVSVGAAVLAVGAGAWAAMRYLRAPNGERSAISPLLGPRRVGVAWRF